MNQMAVFNRELALDRVGGDAELLEEIVELYLDEYPVLFDQIQVAVQSGDAPGLYRSAHTLKGSLGALAAEAAQQCAMELETSGRLGEMAGVSSMVAGLENLLHQLHEELAP